jgi:hypothetical protein
MADWLSLGASLLGGVLGSSASGSSTTQATQSKDPWAPAQPFLLKDLQTNQDLQDWYTKNPFNQQQKVGLQNTMTDADHFRNQVMPGLLSFANNGMTSNYQRASGGFAGSGAGYGGARVQGGLLQSGTGPFSTAPTGGLFGNVDWQAVNPFTNGHTAALAAQRQAAATPATPSGGSTGGLLIGGGGGQGGGSGVNGAQFGGIGIGPATDAINAKAMSIAQQFGLASPIAGVVAGLVSQGMSISEALSAVNASNDPIGALNALQGWTGVGFGDGYGDGGRDGSGTAGGGGSANGNGGGDRGGNS